MSHLKWKLGVAGVVFAAAVTFLVLQGMAGVAYTLSVDQFATQAADYKGKQIRICGIVGAEVRKTGSGTEFTIQGKSHHVRVNYRGVVPDGLFEGAEVIIVGKADANGGFEASELMTKCASKYDDRPTAHPPTGTNHVGTQPGVAP
jgi:cytochrome c-type biogenesis protein CcmE